MCFVYLVRCRLGKPVSDQLLSVFEMERMLKSIRAFAPYPTEGIGEHVSVIEAVRKAPDSEVPGVVHIFALFRVHINPAHHRNGRLGIQFLRSHGKKSFDEAITSTLNRWPSPLKTMR